jgi:uncharacterized Zn finger protein (UPF0148 family)
LYVSYPYNNVIGVRPMAKKKAVKKAPATTEGATEGKTYWTEKPEGKPSKQCPACNVFIHPRSGTCPKCGHAFPKVKRKAKATEKTTRQPRQAKEAPVKPLLIADKQAELRKAIDIVESFGGVAKAEQALATINEAVFLLDTHFQPEGEGHTWDK